MIAIIIAKNQKFIVKLNKNLKILNNTHITKMSNNNVVIETPAYIIKYKMYIIRINLNIDDNDNIKYAPHIFIF